MAYLPVAPRSSAAAIIASERFVDDHGLGDRAIEIASQAMVTDLRSTFEDESCIKIVGYDMSREAANRAYEEAQADASDAQVVELHDCFATAELIHYDNLQLCAPGEAGKFIDERGPWRDGKIPVNVSGGLISKGHPIGATGIANVYEVATHLRGEAGDRQIEGAKVGLTHVIGLGSACAVHVLERSGV